MAFKRKESDNPLRVKAYKFRIYPAYQKPDFEPEEKQALFAEARAMNAFWNKLVTIRASVLESLDGVFNEAKLPFKNESGEKMTYARLKRLSPEFSAETATIWARFESETRELAQSADIKASLGWESREDVFNRFETAHKKALKGGDVLRFKSEKFIEQFHLPHRFSGGGKEFAVFTTGKSKKLYLENIPGEFYENDSYQNRRRRLGNGKFGFGNGDEHQLSFRALIHRRIPEDAKIKTAVLTGKFRNRVWEYFLVLTVDEICEPPLLKSGNLLVAGLDLGWRKFDDYLRVGCIADSYGNAYELRLPLNPAPNARYRRLQRLKAKHNETMSYPQNWQDIEDEQTRNSGAKDLIKERLRSMELPELPDIKFLLAHWDRVGKRGLMKMRRILGDETTKQNETTVKALELLDAWIAETERREGVMDYARRRLLNQRKYDYAKIANWLKTNYAELAIEGDLSLKDLATQGANAKLSEENGAVIKNAAKFRVIASLSELKTAIQQRQLPREEWLVKCKSAYSTTTCYICGTECEKTSRLEIVCHQGHRNDQDVQAALNLRNTLADDFPSHSSYLAIPDKLKHLIVPLAKNL